MNFNNDFVNNNSEYNRYENFNLNNTLSTRHNAFTMNNKSAFTSYFYTNSNTILNKFVMSYEEQLQKAIEKGNFELCKELILRGCNLNAPCNNKFPLCISCEYNYYEIAELLIQV